MFQDPGTLFQDPGTLVPMSTRPHRVHITDIVDTVITADTVAHQVTNLIPQNLPKPKDFIEKYLKIMISLTKNLDVHFSEKKELECIRISEVGSTSLPLKPSISDQKSSQMENQVFTKN